jgi:CcmD family protein
MKTKFPRFRASLLLVLSFLLLATPAAFAQAEAAPEMADGLRASGKIYVVVAAVAIIVAGLLAYLISLDRKVSRLEREVQK